MRCFQKLTRFLELMKWLLVLLKVHEKIEYGEIVDLWLPNDEGSWNVDEGVGFKSVL